MKGDIQLERRIEKRRGHQLESRRPDFWLTPDGRLTMRFEFGQSQVTVTLTLAARMSGISGVPLTLILEFHTPEGTTLSA